MFTDSHLDPGTGLLCHVSRCGLSAEDYPGPGQPDGCGECGVEMKGVLPLCVSGYSVKVPTPMVGFCLPLCGGSADLACARKEDRTSRWQERTQASVERGLAGVAGKAHPSRQETQTAGRSGCHRPEKVKDKGSPGGEVDQGGTHRSR